MSSDFYCEHMELQEPAARPIHPFNPRLIIFISSARLLTPFHTLRQLNELLWMWMDFIIITPHHHHHHRHQDTPDWGNPSYPHQHFGEKEWFSPPMPGSFLLRRNSCSFSFTSVLAMAPSEGGREGGQRSGHVIVCTQGVCRHKLAPAAL